MSNDVTELFQRDPMKLSDQDIDAIIEHMRSRRHLFKQSPTAKAAAKPKKLTAAQERLASLKLDDFDL